MILFFGANCLFHSAGCFLSYFAQCTFVCSTVFMFRIGNSNILICFRPVTPVIYQLFKTWGFCQFVLLNDERCIMTFFFYWSFGLWFLVHILWLIMYNRWSQHVIWFLIADILCGICVKIYNLSPAPTNSVEKATLII